MGRFIDQGHDLAWTQGAVSRREKVISDPPPLAQAYGQAILHASLEAPVSFAGKSRSRRASLSSKDMGSTNALEASIEVKRSHRRTESGESVCSVKEKTFFLTGGPYIMQYDGDAGGDALPEKILALDKDSVAFASDVVPGRHWVLQVSRRRGSGSSPQKAQSLRPTWSRLTLRSAENRRAVDTLLLVFNDSEELHTWLFAIRKEIEDLGGMEYRPDIREDDRTWRDNLTRTFASPSDTETGSHCSTPARTRSPIASSLASPTIITSAALPYGRPQSAQSSTSSKKTSTSLDRFRDSVTSDSYVSTMATSIADGSAPSTSPVCENFPSINTVTDGSNDLTLRAYLLNSCISTKSRSPVPQKSILERRKLSVGSLQLAHIEDSTGRGRRFFTDLAPTTSSLPQSPASFTKHPHDAETTAKPEAAAHVTSADSKPEISVELNRMKQQQQELSLREPTSGSSKPKYSLFPRQSVDTRTEPLASLSAILPSVPTSNTTNLGKVTIKDKKIPESKHRKARSRTLTLNARDQRVSTFLTPGDFGVPQRSPAVTDEMITMNFGAPCPSVPSSPMPIIRVPGLRDLEIDLDFLKAPYQQQPKRNDSCAERKKISSTKSMSKLYTEASSLVAKAPVGPPPAGPLPAVPPESRRSSRTTNRSSQWSQYSQGSQYSRKSGHQSLVDAMEEPKDREDGRSVAAVSSPAHPSRHRRTISSSLDGPPPPERISSMMNERKHSESSRSRSRGRRKSNK
ncbi:hypothetical protein H2198_010511 [Neophaeococcomyces mojaviensis]|uniref:Uncharacterized protein n=1 Tax=Neophaeococcomyces mojaviensis TaxID=3383035 RepID=A0ACC2ZRC1_9EURO|nr:hypothetical protein H2198_010511 [Knufia sp. JES_112]